MTHIDNQSMLRWIAGLGAAAADDVAARFELSPRIARERVRALVRAGMLDQIRLLDGEPALLVATRDGLAAAGMPGLARCRVSAASFAHLRACASVAAALARAHPCGLVLGERELRLLENPEMPPLASAELGWRPDGSAATHRPDLVLWTETEGETVVPGEGLPAALPVAVEVELTLKSPRRLRAIVRAWARSRRVRGVVYYAAPAAARAVRRAVTAEWAEERVEVLALAQAGLLPDRLAKNVFARSTNSIPSAA
jgi:hypothetical protein